MASPATAVRRAGAGMRLLRAAVFAAVCVVLAGVGHALASGTTVPVWSLLLGWLAVFAFVAPLAGRERSLPGIAALLAAGQITLHVVFGTGQMCRGLTASRAADSEGGLLAVAARLVCGGGRGVTLTPQAAQEVLARAGLGAGTAAQQSLHAGHAMASMSGMASMASMPSMSSVPSTGSAAALGSMSSMGSMGSTGSGSMSAMNPVHLAVGTLPAAGGGRGAWSAGLLLGMCSLPMLLGHLLAAVVAGWVLRRGEVALWRLVRLSVRGAAGFAAFSPVVLRRALALLAALTAAAPYVWVRARRAAGGPAARPRTVWLRHSLARRGPPLPLAAV